MKLEIYLLIILFGAGWLQADVDSRLTGKWVSWNHRTVIGTGVADTIIEIKNVGEEYWVSYSFGSIEMIEDTEGIRRIKKETTTTYRRIRLRNNGDIYYFTLPESKQKIRIKSIDKDGTLCLAVVQEDSDQTQSRTFEKFENKKTR